jgi:DNA-binding XRE family transcriptional regulator
MNKKLPELIDDLYERVGGEEHLSRTSFAEFLGVTYQTYCNWRTGKTPDNNFTKFAIESYLSLDNNTLSKMIAKRCSYS